MPETVVAKASEDEREYRHLTLPSGISVLLCSDARAEQRGAAAVCVKGAGARTSPVELPGLAHYLEHMLFLGSAKYPGEAHYKKTVAKYNGRNNASTAPEDTVYHFECDIAGYAEVATILSQFFVGTPLLDAGSSERELCAVTAEVECTCSELTGLLSPIDFAPDVYLQFGHPQTAPGRPQ